MRRTTAACYALSGLCVLASAHAAPAPVLVSEYAQNRSHGQVIAVNPAGAVKDIASAAKLARDGDTVEIQSGEYLGDVAIWTQNNLTIRAVGGRVKLNASGAAAEGKAIWVIRGGAIRIEGFDFTGARVADHNGAGIRFEKGRLTIVNCTFMHNENGILAGEGKDSTLDIEDSEFGYNGGGDGRSHNLYIGAIGQLRVSGSYFHHANVGHLLKSRARENYIEYNRLTDESGGHASYELEFPNGGVNYVIGNLIEQSATTENSTIISMGGEGYTWPQNDLYLSSNTIVDNRPTNGIFLNVKPGPARVRAVNNIVVGQGTLEDSGKPQGLREKAKAAAKSLYESVKSGAADVARAPAADTTYLNNFNVGWDQFALPVRYDFHLLKSTSLQGKFIDPGVENTVSLAPAYEYTTPHGKARLKTRPLYPGAFQSEGAEKK